MEDNLMTVRQVAEKLSVHRMTVLRLISRGELKAVKVAARWRISVEALQEYLKRQAAPKK